MATSTPTAPVVGAVKLASFDVTPAGPLDAARELSPATGSTITPSEEPSLRKRFWEARASAWISAEGDAAFGSVAPSVKTVAGAEDTARGAGVLPRRVADDRETPRVAGVEPDSGPETATRGATAAAAGGDAAAFLGDAAEAGARDTETRAARHVIARALDFDPRESRHTPEKRAEVLRSEREAARGALLAFLARKAETLRRRRAARRAFAAWRGATRLGNRDACVVDGCDEETTRAIAAAETAKKTARLALGAWRLWARAARARAEADALRGSLAEALAARAVADARAEGSPRRGPRGSRSGVSAVASSSSASVEDAETADGGARPPYGALDEKLARWLGVDAAHPPSARGDVPDAGDGAGDGVSERGDPARARGGARFGGSTRGDAGDDATKQPLARERLGAMEALMEATREAEARARALETRNESLETDLYAAAVVWEETERENRLLTERVAAMREDAERLTAALAAAEADAAEAARAATAARRGATAFERGSARERRRAPAPVGVDDVCSRRDDTCGPRRFVVDDEVEELEACAAAMRRSTRRPA